MFDSHYQSSVTKRPITPKPVTKKQNKPLVSVFKSKEVVVTLENGQSVVGAITDTDSHGMLVKTVVDKRESRKNVEKDATVYVPYKSILIVYYTE